MRSICECPCHNTARTARRRAFEAAEWPAAYHWAQEAKDYAGVPADDPVGTVLACARCRAQHYPPPTWTDRPEGASGCWEGEEGG